MLKIHKHGLILSNNAVDTTQDKVLKKHCLSLKERPSVMCVFQCGHLITLSQALAMCVYTVGDQHHIHIQSSFTT